MISTGWVGGVGWGWVLTSVVGDDLVARMARRSSRERKQTMESVAPAGMREVLEAGRLNLRALFRALDRLQLTQEVPSEVRDLFELDADLAEALWGLDQPLGRLDVEAMTADTCASLEVMPLALRRFFKLLSASDQEVLVEGVRVVRASLSASDAYLQIPGRDPAEGKRRHA